MPRTSGGGPSWSNSFPMRPTAPTSPCSASLSPTRSHLISWRPANTGSARRGRRAPRWRSWREQRGLDEELLAGFVAYLGRVAAQPSIDRHPAVRDAAAGTLAGSRLEKAAAELQHELAALVARKEKESARSPIGDDPGTRAD